MQTKLNTLSRTTVVLLIASLASGVMVSTTVSAHPQALFTSQVISSSLAA